MIDLQVFVAQRTVQVDQWQVVPILGGVSLRIRHRPAHLIAQVYLNDTAVSYVRDGPSTLYADLPPTVADGIRKIVLIAGDEAPVGDVVDILTQFLPGRTVSGSARLAQNFLIVLRTMRGSVARAPTFGTNLPSVIKQGMRDRTSARIAVMDAISSATLQILQAQAAQPGLPASERLVSANLEALVDTARGLRADVRLRTAEGIDALVSAGLA